ncbi:MAG: FAD-dependent oxidoreductase [Roseicyclus sp.]|nr:FAD-dependent oxidoreductase [Roseicyclus sp.]
METKTLIVGGGLSGLVLAETLEARGQDYLLVEARDRFGGRILSASHGGAQFDMGPAWFWPGQPRIAAMIERLGLVRFDQFATGDLTFQDHTGQVQRGRGFASMEGSWRLAGGLSALTDALAARLPDTRKRLNAQVVQLARTGARVTASLGAGEAIVADCVVLTLPPRIAAGLAFDPPLPPEALAAMGRVPTWMAGQAKAVAIYNTPFWRDVGLSGDGMSRFGPMVEIHDASPADYTCGALFGFIGVPPEDRLEEAALRAQVLSQLGRLFGPEATTPIALHIKDWAQDPFTATQADAIAQNAHPLYGLPPELSQLWDRRLILSGTETAPQFGGFLEGAFGAVELTLDMLDHV